MPTDQTNKFLVKLSGNQLYKLLGELPTIPIDMQNDQAPDPDTKQRRIAYIRYHWLNNEINQTLIKLGFLAKDESLGENELTKKEIRRRCRILAQREDFRPEFNKIEKRLQEQHGFSVSYKPRSMPLCSSKQWEQHCKRCDEEETQKVRRFLSKADSP